MTDRPANAKRGRPPRRPDGEAAPGPGAGIARDIVMLYDPAGPRAEAIRALRTHLIAHHLHGGRRALAVCAAGAGVGCSFVAANLAVAMSQVGLNTLLIDADLRRPTLQRFFPLAASTAGLAQCLGAGATKFGDYLRPGVLDHLWMMFAGDRVANPQELLGGEAFIDLTESCLRDFDITIVDTPPANLYADARRISSVVGYSLVVARRNVSLIEDVKTLVGELTVDHAQVVGTVLNEL